MSIVKVYIILAGLSLLVFGSCKKINTALEVDAVQYYRIQVNARSTVPSIEDLDGLAVKFTNFKEGIVREGKIENGQAVMDSLPPGLYSINIAGLKKDKLDDSYYLNAGAVNYAIVTNDQTLDLQVGGLKQSPLIFSQIYYCGSAPFYFRDQFYEIYNNSEEIVYLDGLHFATLTPTIATTVLPVWPVEDGNKYVYADRVWKIPGKGKDFPLLPGESIDIAQFAANHKLAQYNRASPIDCSTAEFEFNMDNPNFPNQPALDMQHVFYNGNASKGSVPQYLTSVFGAAYVIFRVPEGGNWDPVNDNNLKTRNLGATGTQLFAKIPRTYLWDAVEAGHNANMITAKRVPAEVDAGMTYVGATYIGQAVARKVREQKNNGAPFFMDTNNSTDDFERNVIPQFRRNGEKKPSWSPSK
ncbi:DUF4876 domain-containing protein [Sphingobacterium sp. BIGb0165]|uniref:DUF4876 domain-containing protein n=1 Tax=Sphingobacterium sp. BIGb0165 TaxID=2940615 RepID=UPI0021691492|nr:DUF4876 domain-containing protein [Sphingobacterium sp. BIGb0165]MCS4226477.1 hypothetical protein [Sphingobacterium sp. BIGb0165]